MKNGKNKDETEVRKDGSGKIRKEARKTPSVFVSNLPQYAGKKCLL
jgi:hypothetical protein